MQNVNIFRKSILSINTWNLQAMLMKWQCFFYVLIKVVHILNCKQFQPKNTLSRTAMSRCKMPPLTLFCETFNCRKCNMLFDFLASKSNCKSYAYTNENDFVYVSENSKFVLENSLKRSLPTTTNFEAKTYNWIAYLATNSQWPLHKA